MTAPATPTFREALRFWCRLGWISFGGPSGQIAIMHRELVEDKKWIEETRFLHALNFCLLLPGPEAQQLATYLGWHLHGVRGGVCAGLLFILPSVFILWALSILYVMDGSMPLVAAAFHGLVPAVIAIVFSALFRLGRKTLRDPLHWGIALVAAMAVTIYRDGYPLIIVTAGFLGWLFHRHRKAVPEPTSTTTTPRIATVLLTATICVAVWLAPLLAAACWLGWDHTVTREGVFFSKAALVTFGGAYAVLPYVAQHAVETYHWLTPDQMLHGFGLAETTPGPLIMVLQFIGFMGGWHQPGMLTPLAAATLGSLLTTWVTFAPSFLFILTGAPFVDRLIQVQALQSALGAISAAVVGVMAAFAVWFAGQAIFPQGTAGRPDLFVVVVGVAALAGLMIWNVGVARLIGLCALLGVLWLMITG